MPRPLGPDEKALWGRVIATVEPLHEAKVEVEVKELQTPPKPVRVERSRDTPKSRTTSQCLDDARHERKLIVPPATLDGHWNRRIHRGGMVPDISIDLHDSNLSSAYTRLDRALEQAIAEKLKVILLVTGKARAHDRTSGQGRGAIAAVVRDWLAASRHARNISAVRNAHPKHGGAGALYIILKS